MSFDPTNDFELQAGNYFLKVLDATYALSIAHYFERNRSHFSRSMPGLEFAQFSKENISKKMWSEFDDMLEGAGIHLFIFAADDIMFKNILGDIYFSNIIGGFVRSCSLGFKLDKDQTGRGIMYEALRPAFEFVFNDLNIHRIEANILPENIPSVKIVEKLGFVQEGTARKYAQIEGEWLDHLRYSLLKEDFFK